MSSPRTLLNAAAVVGVLGLGYMMWVSIAPGAEQRRELLKNMPESNPLRMEETRKRNALMMQVIKEAAETNENIARGINRTK